MFLTNPLTAAALKRSVLLFAAAFKKKFRSICRVVKILSKQCF